MSTIVAIDVFCSVLKQNTFVLLFKFVCYSIIFLSALNKILVKAGKRVINGVVGTRLYLLFKLGEVHDRMSRGKCTTNAR